MPRPASRPSRHGRTRSKRRSNHRLVKTHRNYTVDEAATLLGVAKVTVRRWIKCGALPAVTDKKPALILGGELADFLKARSTKGPKLPLSQCYCFKCRTARSPALDMVEYAPLNDRSGNLRALCAKCSTVMHKAISAGALPELERLFDLSIVERQRHLMDTSNPSLNDHLPKEAHTHA